MHNLSTMIAEVKKHVRAAENLTWTDDDCESALVDAARIMWRHVASSDGRRCLRTFSVASPLPAGGVMHLPSDCLRLEEVIHEFPGVAGVNVRRPIKYARLDSRETEVPWGRAVPWFESPAWSDDMLEGEIRIAGLRPGDGIVFQYIQEPVFPFAASGTLRNPGNSSEGDAYRSIPDLCDMAVEYLAAALMLGEEVKDEAPIGYNGQQYSSLLAMVFKAPQVMPSRRYVNRVSKR